MALFGHNINPLDHWNPQNNFSNRVAKSTSRFKLSLHHIYYLKDEVRKTVSLKLALVRDALFPKYKNTIVSKIPKWPQSNMIKFRKFSWALPGSGLWCILIISLGGQRKLDVDRCASYRAQAHPPSHPQEVSRNYGWISISPPSGSSDHGAESLMTNTYFLTLERSFSITETTLIITRFPPWINRFSSLHGLC